MAFYRTFVCLILYLIYSWWTWVADTMWFTSFLDFLRYHFLCPEDVCCLLHFFKMCSTPHLFCTSHRLFTLTHSCLQKILSQVSLHFRSGQICLFSLDLWPGCCQEQCCGVTMLMGVFCSFTPPMFVWSH